MSKNTAVHYNGVKINIVDTPGHADFSGEVERVLKMVSGVLLLVDSFEGPMPQTRFVLKKALELNLKVIIVINKMDRPDARCEEVVDETLELLMELDATDEQLDSPILFASGRTGTATDDWKNPGRDLRPLFDCILSHIPAPSGDPDQPLQLLISTIDYNDYVGRIGVGRIERGTIQAGQTAIRCVHGSSFVSAPARLAGLYTFDGLKRVNAESASVGDIVAISGFPGPADRRHGLQSGHGGAAAVRQDRRADHLHDLLRQRQPGRRHRRASSSPPATCARASSARR